VPDAFLTTSKNKIAMQVGAFSDRVKAEQLIQTLANQGISSNLEPINQ
jgi:cell division protein FtsN